MNRTPKCEENNENLDPSNVLHQTLKVRDDLTLPTIEILPLEENIAHDTNPQLEMIPEPVPVRIRHDQFACPICRKVMKNLQNMKNHIMIHTGQRPFACVHCEKSFQRKNQLSKHLKNVHSQK